MSLADNRLILAYHSVSPNWQVDTNVTPSGCASSCCSCSPRATAA